MAKKINRNHASKCKLENPQNSPKIASNDESDSDAENTPKKVKNCPVVLSKEQLELIESRKQEALKKQQEKRIERFTETERQFLHISWQPILADQFRAPYFLKLKEFLQSEREKNVKLFPPEEMIYSWSNFCPFERVKVVILGQDPYHNDGQAMGLAFSVPKGFKPLPPSLINIFKELKQEIPDKFVIPTHGCLSRWADRGVLLLNATLTVRAHEAASHSGKGWEILTDAVVRALNERRNNLVFMLWGSHAQKKGAAIDKSKHLILNAAHPSPLSASKGFFGCNHFVKANNYLLANGKEPIDWNLL